MMKAAADRKKNFEIPRHPPDDPEFNEVLRRIYRGTADRLAQESDTIERIAELLGLPITENQHG
jgi:hypothetical protein